MKRILFVASLTALMLFVLLLVPSRYAQVVKKLDLNVIYHQDGSPIAIVSATSDLNYFFAKAEVSNVSERRITSITICVFMHENGRNSNGVLVSKHEIATDLQPGTARDIDTFGIQTKVARQRAMNFKTTPIAVDFGILEVQFEDGGIWHSAASDSTEFPAQESSFGVGLGKKWGQSNVAARPWRFS